MTSPDVMNSREVHAIKLASDLGVTAVSDTSHVVERGLWYPKSLDEVVDRFRGLAWR